MNQYIKLISFIIVLIILSGNLILLYPKISNRYLSYRRQQILKDFIDETKKNNNINLQHYWQLREFYCPGYAVYNRSAAYRNQPFLTYYCHSFKSTDTLVDNNDYLKIKQQIKDINKTVLFKNDNEIIYQLSKKSIKIIFILPAEKMKTTIGYFDYNEKDIKLTEGKYWYNQSTILL